MAPRGVGGESLLPHRVLKAVDRIVNVFFCLNQVSKDYSKNAVYYEYINRLLHEFYL
jgi:hypothetical protein